MPQKWKTIKIFISSTFRDMHAERDHLVRFVFPELKEKCRKERVHLIDVDLRWGVTEADAQDGKALDICLDEIDFCRPYFLGLLGHRYGWIPPGQKKSITAQEIYHGVLHNAVPRQIVDLRQINDGRLEGKALTDEQINCLVRCYQWEANKGKYLLIDDTLPDDLNIIRSIFHNYSAYQKDRSFFFFRSETLSRELAGPNINDFFETDDVGKEKLTSLKQEIIDDGLPYFEYDDIETFGHQVGDILWKRIESELEQTPQEDRGWLEEEAELHELFMADRTRRFVGRRDLLDRMNAFCEGQSESTVMVITGAPGCGKSALMARFTEKTIHNHPDWITIPHFVGASPSSTNLRQTLRRFCVHLSSLIESPEEVPQDIKELLQVFPELLEKAAERRRVLIILDGVNQLEMTESAHDMRWLPQELPGNVKVAITTLPGETHDALLSRRINLALDEVAGLDVSEVRGLVADYLKEIRREFPNKQVEEAFFTKVKEGNPLYIMVALEELRVFGKFEDLSGRIDALPETVPDLFDQVLERIESDFNPALVRDCMSYITCGKQGMTAEELQALLTSHAPQQDATITADKLPDMIWIRLYRAFGPYIFERSGVIDFFHGQLKEAVGQRYVREGADCAATHRTIADYFEKRWREPYIRAIDELPHQRIKAEDWEGVEGILTDLDFIEAKCAICKVMELISDYRYAEGSLPVAAIGRWENHQTAEETHVLHRAEEPLPFTVIGEMLRAEAAAISTYPNKALSQIVNRLAFTTPTGTCEICRSALLDACRSKNQRILYLETQHHQALESRRILVKIYQHAGVLRGVAALETPGLFVWVASDGTVGFSDLRLGILMRTIRVDDLVNDTLLTQVLSCCAVAHHVLVGLQSGHILRIEPETGKLVETYRGSQAAVMQVERLDMSQFIALYSDGKIGVWQDGKVDGPTYFLPLDAVHTCFLVDSDGKRVITGTVDGTVHRWDISDTPQDTVLTKASGQVRSLCQFSKGNMILFATRNHVWATDTSTENKEANRLFTDIGEGYLMCPVGGDCVLLGTRNHGIFLLNPSDIRVLHQYSLIEPIIGMALAPHTKTVGIITPSSLYCLDLSATRSNKLHSKRRQDTTEKQDVPPASFGQPLGIVRGKSQAIRVLTRQGNEILQLLYLTGRKWKTLLEWRDIQTALIDEDSETLYTVTKRGEITKCYLGLATERQPSHELLLNTGRSWSDTYLSLYEHSLAAMLIDFNGRCGLLVTFSPTAELTFQTSFTGLLGPMRRALFVDRRYIALVSYGRSIPVFDIINDSFREIEITAASRGGMGVAVLKDLIPIGGGSVILSRATDGTFTSLDLASGRKIGNWKTESSGTITHACQWRDEQIIVSDQSGAIHCHDGHSGKCLWSLGISDYCIDGFSIDSESGHGLAWSTDGKVSLFDATSPRQLAFWVSDSLFKSCVTRVFNGRLYGVFLDTQDRLGLLAELF